MPRTPPPEGQVTLSDAVQHLHEQGLDVSEGMIYKWVAAGRLKRYGPETRKQKFYLLEELDQILKEELTGSRRPKPAPVLIDWLRPNDIPAALKLDQIVYNEVYLAEASVYQAWRVKNLHISIAAFDKQDRNICLAYASLVPVPEQVAVDVIAGKRTDNSITVDEVEKYDHPGAYTLLGVSAVSHPDRPDLLFQIIKGHMQFWLEMYPEKYIRKIYAQAVSDDGERLAQHFFMSPRYDLAYNAFELDLARPGASKAIRNYQQRLREKAPLPPDLQWPPVISSNKP